MITGSVCATRLMVENKDSIITESGNRTKGIYKKSRAGKPLVTIITVVYNRAEKIARAIQSVINQSYDNIEYIVIDGGSTDGTVDVIKQYEEAIDYFVSEPDDGIYNAINKGLSLAAGDYIGILNSDDWYIEDAVQLSIDEIIKNSADYSGAEEYVVNEDGEVLGIYQLKHFDEVALIAQNPCNHGTMFISRTAYDCIGYYDETYRIAADFKMQLLLVLNKKLKGCTVPKPIHYYELLGLSSVQRDKTLIEVVDVLQEFHTNLSINEIKSLVNFMHENQWSESIIKDLEVILSSQCYSKPQKEYLLQKMNEFGYQDSDRSQGCYNEMSGILPRLTIRKVIKYLMPYGLVKFIKKRNLIR